MNYEPVTLACPELPLRCLDPETGTVGFIKELSIQSRLPAPLAIGHLRRNGPTLSLSPHVYKLLSATSASVTTPGACPLIAFVGEKGTGKTSAAELVGYLVDGTPPEVFHCGGRSLDDLLFEPILETSRTSPIEEIARRMNLLSPLSIKLLRAASAEAIQEDPTGKITFNAEKIATEELPEVLRAIKTIEEIEGITANNNGIGVTYNEGPLIRIWKNAQEASGDPNKPTRLIVDELDKRLPGTGKSLQQVWLVLRGLKDSCTVEQNGISFTFSKKNMPKGFSVVLTGNDERDLGDSTGLSQSQASRIPTVSINKTTEEDLTIRICQALCGIDLLSTESLPISSQEKAKTLEQLRLLGEEDPLTEEESWMIQNHEKTLAAARQLASFYLKWEMVVDPENPGVDDPILEATKAHREPPGVRMAHAHILEAKTGRFLPISFSPPPKVENPVEALLQQKTAAPVERLGLGTRLEQTIREAIQNYPGGRETKSTLLEIAKSEGLLDEEDEESNKNKAHRRIQNLLNTNDGGFEISPRATAIQKALYSHFVNTYFQSRTAPEMQALLPIREIQTALEKADLERAERSSDKTTYILNINPRFLGGNKTEKPIEMIPVLNSGEPSHIPTISHLHTSGTLHQHMVEKNSFLTLLETPYIQTEVLNALWPENWKKVMASHAEEAGLIKANEALPNGLQMVTGEHPHLRIAKILVRGEEGTPEPLLVLHSPEKKQVWALGEDIAKGRTPFTSQEAAETKECAVQYVNTDKVIWIENDLKILFEPEQVEEMLADIESASYAFHRNQRAKGVTENLEAALGKKESRGARIPLQGPLPTI